ncbi:MAG: hypothetical protein ABIK09_02090 [Pseudomonadota bacterium]
MIATLDDEPSIWIWNAADGTLVRRLRLGETQYRVGCAFAPGRHQLMIYGLESGLEVRDVRTGGLVHR